MSDYSIFLKKHATESIGLIGWCLDFPKDKDKFAAAEFTEQGIVFQGWLLATTSAQLFLRQGEHQVNIPLERNRPDVIKAVLQQEPQDHAKLSCGFRVSICLNHPHFVLGVTVDGVDTALVTGEIRGAFQVLQGKDGWLFLDNDTNKSVEQFTGKQLIEPHELRHWKSYFKGVSKLTSQLKLPYVMLMAPSKELVYEQFYPHAKGKVTAIEQLMTLLPSQFPFLHPVSQLQAMSERSFRVTDTHWSIHGAAKASELCALELGVPAPSVQQLFADDVFYTRDVVGDLGNKIFPPAKHAEAVLKNYSYRKFVTYDNQLPNFGRVVVIQQPAAIRDAHLLVLGSSSAYSMLNHLTRVFSTVTLIHTAGNVEPQLVKELAPDFLIVQTNARFVVRAPTCDYCLVTSMTEKLGLLSDEAWQQQGEDVAKQADTRHPVQVLHAKYVQARQQVGRASRD